MTSPSNSPTKKLSRNQSISLEEAKRVIELDRRTKEREHDQKLNAWIESKIGSTWVYRNNCYSAYSERWDVFMKVIDRVGNCKALVETWESMNPKKRLAEINIEERHLYHEEGFTGYVECSQTEFENMKNKILKLLRLPTSRGKGN